MLRKGYGGLYKAPTNRHCLPIKALEPGLDPAPMVKKKNEAKQLRDVNHNSLLLITNI